MSSKRDNRVDARIIRISAVMSKKRNAGSLRQLFSSSVYGVLVMIDHDAVGQNTVHRLAGGSALTGLTLKPVHPSKILTSIDLPQKRESVENDSVKGVIIIRLF